MTDSHYRVEELLEHSDWVRRLAYALAGNPHDADDLLQDAMRAALVRPPTRSGSARGWLARVVRNRWIEIRRAESKRRAREGRVALSETEQDGTEEVERFEASQAVIEVLRELDEPYLGVLLKIYYGGKTAAQAARELGRSADTVRSQHNRGLARLRKEWGKRHRGRSAYLAALLPLLRWGDPPALAEFAGLTFPPPPRFPVEVAPLTAAAVVASALLIAFATPRLFMSDEWQPPPVPPDWVPEVPEHPDQAPDDPETEEAAAPEIPAVPAPPRNEIGVALALPRDADPELVAVTVTGVAADGTRTRIEGADVGLVDGRLGLSLDEVRKRAPDAEEIEVRVEHPDCLAETLFSPVMWMAELPERVHWEEEVRLEAAIPVTGRVVDDLGQPLAGATVAAFEAIGEWSAQLLASSVADADGGFTLALPAAESYLVTAVLDGRPPALATKVGSDWGDLVCPRGFEIRGIVRDVLGRPMEGVQVDAHMQSSSGRKLHPLDGVDCRGDRAWRTTVRSTTDAEGRYQLRGLSVIDRPDGAPYTLHVGQWRGLGLQIPIDDPAAVNERDIDIAGVRVELGFRQGGAAAPGHVQVARGKEVIWDEAKATGRVPAILPLDEALTVAFIRNGEQRFDLIVPSARSDDPFWFELVPEQPEGASLEVHLIDANSEPIPTASFWLWHPDGKKTNYSVDRSRLYRGAGGRFILRGLTPGDWVLEAFPGGRESIGSFQAPVTIPVAIPDSGGALARLPATEPGGRMRVRVRLPSGRYAPVGTSCLVFRDGKPVPCGFAQQNDGANPSRTLQLPRPATSDRALPAGSYEIRASRVDYGSGTATVTVERGKTVVADITLRR